MPDFLFFSFHFLFCQFDYTISNNRVQNYKNSCTCEKKIVILHAFFGKIVEKLIFTTYES